MRFGAMVFIASVVMYGVGAGPAQAQLASGPGKWWKSESFKRELSLTSDQSDRIEQIFQTSFGTMRATKRELDREEASLSRLMADPAVDEADVSRSIDRVEAARCVLSKERTLMLYRIHRILSTDQRAKLEELDQRAHGGRGRSR